MRIVESAQVIRERIIQALKRRVHFSFLRTRDRLHKQLSTEFKEWIRQSPEILSMREDARESLKAAFGLTPEMSSKAILAITELLSNSIHVFIEDGKKYDIAVINIGFVTPENWKELVGLPEGVFFSEGAHAGEVRWLEWLLTAGTTVVVSFDIVYGNFSNSRTGLALMTKANRGSFRVPPQYSGTMKNNFVTRTIATHLDDISKIIFKYIKESLK